MFMYGKNLNLSTIQWHHSLTYAQTNDGKTRLRQLYDPASPFQRRSDRERRLLPRGEDGGRAAWEIDVETVERE